MPTSASEESPSRRGSEARVCDKAMPRGGGAAIVWPSGLSSRARAAFTLIKEEKGFRATCFTPIHRLPLRVARCMLGEAHKASQTGGCCAPPLMTPGRTADGVVRTVQSRPAGQKMQGSCVSRDCDP